MFTGIVAGTYPISKLEKKEKATHFSVALPERLLNNLEHGASISVDGVCLTVVDFDESLVSFDVIEESLNKTTLKSLHVGREVNIERALCVGDELGGHILSGHVYGEGKIEEIIQSEDNHKIIFSIHPEWVKYFFPKGFIAIDGVSLTLVDVEAVGRFSVCLIPETLRRTTLGFKKVGDLVNIELESQVQATVDTVERVLASKEAFVS